MKNNVFNSIKISAPKRNTFDLSHDVKMTGKMGTLMPVMALEVLPADEITLGADTLIRFAPLIAPVMHRMDATIHYFFVPNRIIWPKAASSDGWEEFIANNSTGGIPFVTIDGTETPAEQKFLDYMGIPPHPGGANPPQNISALPFAAYQTIYNEYYRDQNLVTTNLFQDPLVDGDNNAVKEELFTLRLRAWEHDYFTASLPFAQKGAAVDIPLGTVELDPNWTAGTNVPRFETDVPSIPVGSVTQPAGNINVGATTGTAYNPDGTLVVGSTTINDLRRAFKLQEWLEKMARAGTRYKEIILSQFGVRSSDARLDRPEYITGTKTPVIISEVLNTSGTFDPSTLDPTSPPQGNMAGHGVAVGSGYTGKYRVEEHGYIIGIMSVRPKPAYSQGIPKHYLRTDPTEYFWDSFAHIGEQPVLQKELYAYEATGNDTFGYIPRYSEYRYCPPRIAGDFRSTLSYWTLSRQFAAPPQLNQTFVEVDPDEQDTIFAVQDGTDYLYIEVLNKIKARRPIPVFGTPML